MKAYRQIYERFRRAISEGRLGPGDRLPSVRALASELGVARGTVDTAYALLAGEGYVITRGRSATIVAPGLAPASKVPAAQQPAGPAIPRLPDDGPLFATYLPLTPGLPALDLFPRSIWARLVGREARRITPAEQAYADPKGALALRSAVAGYLAVSRGIQCSPEQVLITGGYQAALGLISRVLLEPGAPVWVENPGYPPTRWALKEVGATAIPVPVDCNGMVVEHALRARPDAALCVVTPTHQFPLGVTLPLHRRQMLLDWAAQRGGWILEDDYDSEFRHQGRAPPALQSLDRGERVFYVGTFSKTLFPSLRLGYVVAPASQVARLTSALRWLDGGRSGLEAQVVAEFLSEGHFGRHLKRMRAAYSSRRRILGEAIADAFGCTARVEPGSGGLHLILRANDLGGDKILAQRALLSGLRPVALSDMAFDGADDQGLLVGFANTPPAQAPVIARRLWAALRSVA